MSQSITIRLTPARERLLNLVKRRFKVKKNSEAIDIALKMSFDENIDYRTRLQKVTGCINLKGKENAIERIRSLRDGK